MRLRDYRRRVPPLLLALALATPALARSGDEPSYVRRCLEGYGLADDIAARADGARAPGPSELDEEASGKRRGSFVALPTPMANPTLGTGIKVMAAYITRLSAKDEVSPPSVFGGVGFYTDSKSWLAAVGAKLYLFEDRLRLLGGYAPFDLRYDYFGEGNEAGDNGVSIPIRQDGNGYLFEGLIRLFERVYAGPQYTRATIDTRLNLDELEEERAPADPSAPELPPSAFEVDLAALTAHVQRDTRPSQFYPRSGSLLDFKVGFRTEGLGSDFSYDDYTLAYNHFFGVRSDKDVLGLRGYLCGVDGDAPFFGLCQFGIGADLRGYTGGRYRDAAMFAAQGEYRWQPHRRWIGVAFAGVGEVAPGFSQLRADNLLWSGGVGVRFVLAPRDGVNIRADYAWGKNDGALYVSLGEAF